MRTGFNPTQARDAISDMMSVLRDSGHPSFDGEHLWEDSLCALVLALEPKCRTYRLLESLPYKRNELDQTDVLNTLAYLGYYARSLKADLSVMDARLFPCLFINEENIPFIVLDKNEDGFKVYKDGTTFTLSEKKASTRHGRFWVFERYDESRPSISKFMRAGSGHSWFRAFLGRFRKTFIQVMTAGLALNLIALTTPLFIMMVYNRVIAAGTLETLPMLAVGVAMAIGFEWVLRAARSGGLSWLAARMDNIVSNRIFSHLIGLSPDLIERASVAAQIARIKTFESVRDFFSGSVFLSMMEMPFVVLALIAIYAIAGALVLVPIAMLGVYTILFILVQHRVKITIRLAAKASSARQQFAIETFEKLRGIRGYGLTRLWQQKFRDLSGREMMAHFRLNWLGMMAETFAHALTILSAVCVIGFGVHMIWAGAITTGALVATMILVWRVLTPFYSLCTMIPRLEQLRHSIIQVNKLMDIDTEATEARSAARLPKIQGRIGFSHAMLRYGDNSDAVISDFTFEALPGDLVVITGENGSGKSSLLKLVKGLYKASEGSVQIDGFDIRQLDAPDLRRQIAYVPQQADFFQGTIVENLRLCNPLATEDDIARALQMADAWEDIMHMPGGIHTTVGRYAGRTLPPDFASRLALARAYLHTAPIMLIDELPNAVLSSRTGANLRDYLVQTKGKRTCIMVTYRQDFMAIADSVIMLRRGEDPVIGKGEQLPDNMMEVA